MKLTRLGGRVPDRPDWGLSPQNQVLENLENLEKQLPEDEEQSASWLIVSGLGEMDLLTGRSKRKLGNTMWRRSTSSSSTGPNS